MNKSIIGIAAAIILSGTQFASAFELGYCTDDTQRSNIFRLGSTTKQGMAIKLDSEKIAQLKGAVISGADITVGSSRTDDGTLDIFVATSPDGTPLASQNVKIGGATRWTKYMFDAPYTITGDEQELYIGYTAEINTQSSMLMADHTLPIEGRSFVYENGKWVDTYTLNVGNASIRAIVDNSADFVDALLKPTSLSGYFKANTEYTASAQIFNFGTQPITAFDVDVTLGDDAPLSLSFTDLNIPQNAVYDIELPGWMASTEGVLPLKIEVTGVNGSGEQSTADNSYTADMFFYPPYMERSVLLEGFTGQTCPNCPTGHTTTNNFVHSDAIDTPIIEVMHHAGYYPDLFTMEADLDYTYLYGSSSTYAPAFTMNRAHVPTLGNVPVMGVSAANLEKSYDYVCSLQPYVSLSLNSTFDPSTREVTVKVSSLTHNDLPEGQNVINVMLTQDGIVANQTPLGDGYIHNAVCRGVITGNSWGILLPDEALSAGGRYEWSKTFTLPEGIFSDYYDAAKVDVSRYTIEAVPENMKLVAYVAGYGDTVNDHTVYNSIETKLGDSYTQGGMSASPLTVVDPSDRPEVSVVGGHIVVTGACDSLSVYTIDGRSVSPASRLLPGLYILRAANGNAVTVKKVLVK